MEDLNEIAKDPRVTIRRTGQPLSDGNCVVYWMQRSQRGIDNPALDAAVEAANALRKPIVVFFAPVPFYPRANLRHYRFLNEGVPDIEASLSKRNIGFVLRRYPEHSLVRFCDEVKAALVVGDENPMREPENWRRTAARKLKVPFWTVDSDVIVPSSVLEKAQYAAHTIRPRLQAQLKRFLVPARNQQARVPWKKPKNLESLPPDSDISQSWQLETAHRGNDGGGDVAGAFFGTHAHVARAKPGDNHGMTQRPVFVLAEEAAEPADALALDDVIGVDRVRSGRARWRCVRRRRSWRSADIAESTRTSSSLCRCSE